MTREKKHAVAAGLLVVLGILIGAIGVVGRIGPPIITGVGFLVIAWALSRVGES